MFNCISIDIQTNKKQNRFSKQYHLVDGCWDLLEIRIGLKSFTADVIDDDNGLIILICLGTSGTVSPLFSGLGFGDATNRIVGGDVEFEEILCCSVFDNADLAIERRITRALFVNEGSLVVCCISFVSLLSLVNEWIFCVVIVDPFIIGFNSMIGVQWTCCFISLV